ncbi:MAG: 3-hydroxyacyl-CoA dehydrogenase family protein, partial [Dehalococcoidales bacterium]|nr:3-hydroxyacyl-CoA dehydrogenase family protein [Dehalococcoidales bacterium]
GLGHPIGPIALMDFNGLDVIYLTQKAFYDQMGDPNKVPSKLSKKLVDEGHLGRKNGKGFYDYSKEKKP